MLASNLRGRPVAHRELRLDVPRDSPETVASRLADLVGDLEGELAGYSGSIAGLVAIVAGMVDAASGMVYLSPALGWQDVPLRELLNEALDGPDYPVLVDRRGRLCVEAERRAEPGATTRDLVVLFGDLGVGGGALVNGRTVLGAHGLGGEFAHVVVDPNGPECDCGARGCLGALVGLPPLAEAAGLRLGDGSGLAVVVEQLRTRAADGDDQVVAELRRQATWLGTAAATLVNVFDPEAVVLAGWFGILAEWMLPTVRSVLDQRLVLPQRRALDVGASTLGLQAPIHGGVGTVLEHVFADPVGSTGVAPRSKLISSRSLLGATSRNHSSS